MTAQFILKCSDDPLKEVARNLLNQIKKERQVDAFNAWKVISAF